jgi:L-rhamnose-H+ transport protein
MRSGLLIPARERTRNLTANPFIGVTLHWIGGLAAASFYIPFKRVKKWSWETYWLVGGIFSWVIAPHLLAWALVPNLKGIFHEVPAGTMGWAYFFGVLWGIGGLTFGLSVRYLGVALGYAVALGMCAIFGTLIPPIFHGQIGKMAADHGGQVTLLGIAVCMVGIIFSAMAGMSKERELGASQQPRNHGRVRLRQGNARSAIRRHFERRHGDRLRRRRSHRQSRTNNICLQQAAVISGRACPC